MCVIRQPVDILHDNYCIIYYLKDRLFSQLDICDLGLVMLLVVIDRDVS